MCGIAGFLNGASNELTRDLGEISSAMDISLQHRGPDDHGVWIDESAGVALVHRRLSILDLSPAGHQPMISADGRFVIIYNGEVYSYQPIAAELAASGLKFRGHSDTEAILNSFAVNGIEATLKRMIGMFAIALWDRRDRTLTLIRDRLGIKPLYWAKFGKLFLFGSELKALRAHPGWAPQIDRDAVAAYMRHNYIPAPHTIYQGVHKLEPGTILTLPWQGEPQISRFWNARTVAHDGTLHPLETGDAELTEQLETLLQDAVSRRMIADVPLGAFLSGGVDSSTVVALMQKARLGKVRTFSIGFDLPGYNEAPHAAAVARHLGTDHTELTVTSSQALDVIPQLPGFYDEPFAELLANSHLSGFGHDAQTCDGGVVGRRRRRAVCRLQSLSFDAAVLAGAVAHAAVVANRRRGDDDRSTAGPLDIARRRVAGAPSSATDRRQTLQARCGVEARQR